MRRVVRRVMRVRVRMSMREYEVCMRLGVGLQQIRDTQVILEQVAEHRLRRELAVAVVVRVG